MTQASPAPRGIVIWPPRESAADAADRNGTDAPVEASAPVETAADRPAPKGRGSFLLDARRVVARGFFAVQGLLAKIVSLVTLVVVALIVLGGALVILDANTSNALVKPLLRLVGTLVHPFAGDLHSPLTKAYLANHQAVFSPHTLKKFVAENWGLAAAVYLAAGLVLNRLVRFGKG